MLYRRGQYADFRAAEGGTSWAWFGTFISRWAEQGGVAHLNTVMVATSSLA